MRRSCKAAAVALMVLAVGPAAAMADSVDGYIRRDGTYVQPYQRSERNNSYNDNWSTRGNTNPYTGEKGTASPTWSDRSPESNRRNYGTSGTGGYGDNTYRRNEQRGRY